MNLYYITLDEAQKLNEQYCKAFFPKRFALSKKYKKEADALRCIGAGALMHKVLGINENSLYCNENGKPYLPDSRTFFNISHSGDYTVLVCDDKEVGVDIEKICENHLTISDMVYTSDELLWMQADKVNRFHILWTIKESVIKAVGKGLSLNPQSFSAMPAIMGKSISVCNFELFCKNIKLGDCQVAICAQSPIERVKMVECKAENRQR